MEYININDTCPICHNKLGPGEMLIAEYTGMPFNRFIVFHYKSFNDYKDRHSYCALTGFQLIKE